MVLTEGVLLLFWPARERSRYSRVSRHDGRTVVLCDLPGCSLCNFSARESLKGLRGNVDLLVSLELRRSYGGGMIAPRERYIAHVVSRSEEREARIVEVPVEPEEVEAGAACNAVLCQSGGLGLLIDPGAVGFGGEGKEAVRLLVQGRRLVAVMVTHGHMDHSNGLPGIGRRDVPVFMTRLAQQVILSRQDPGGAVLSLVRRAELVVPGQSPIIEIGSAFRISTFPLSHSIPGTMGLVVWGSQRTLVYLGDFRLNGFDSLSMAQTISLLREIAKRGVDILALNIVNAHVPGFTPIEAKVIGTLTEVLAKAPGRVIVACFSSSLERIRRIVEVAQLLERPVAFYGAGMRNARDILGLKAKEGEVDSDNAVIFVTGCQAEPNSVLWRIAKGQNPPFELRPDDTLVLSSRAIPGSEAGLRQLVGDLWSQVGRTIVNEGDIKQVGLDFLGVVEALTHVSGHECEEGLRLVMEILQPKSVLAWPQSSPQIEAFREIAEELGIEVLPEAERTFDI